MEKLPTSSSAANPSADILNYQLFQSITSYPSLGAERTIVKCVEAGLPIGANHPTTPRGWKRADERAGLAGNGFFFRFGRHFTPRLVGIDFTIGRCRQEGNCEETMALHSLECMQYGKKAGQDWPTFGSLRLAFSSLRPIFGSLRLISAHSYPHSGRNDELTFLLRQGLGRIVRKFLLFHSRSERRQLYSSKAHANPRSIFI